MNHLKFLPLVLLLVMNVQAHDTVNAGNVNLEWHTDTNEFLQAEGDSVLTISLKVKDQVLKLRDCRCTLLLYPGEVSPRVKPTLLNLTESEEGTLETVITALKVGPYSVVVDAKPANINAFTAFRAVLKLTAVEDVNNAQQGKK